MSRIPPGRAGPQPVVLNSRVADRAARRNLSWSLEHLRWCWLVLAPVTGVLAAAGALVAGPGALTGALLGGLIVGVFFSASTWAIARMGRRSTRAILPTALGVYLIKIVLLGVVLSVIPAHGWLDVRWLAGGVVLGLIAWLGTHLRYVWTAKIFYVDPT